VQEWLLRAVASSGGPTRALRYDNDTMGRSVNISTEIPPPLSMIERLGISKARQRQLTAMVDAAIEGLGKQAATGSRSEAGSPANSNIAAIVGHCADFGSVSGRVKDVSPKSRSAAPWKDSADSGNETPLHTAVQNRAITRPRS